MSNQEEVKAFGDLSSKLSRPTKQSQFERQKAEEEAKRKRQEAEAEEELGKFLKDFEGDDDIARTAPRNQDPNRSFGSGSFRYGAGPSGASGAGRYKRLHSVHGASTHDRSRSERGLFAYEDERGSLPLPRMQMDATKAFDNEPDEDEMDDGRASKRIPSKLSAGFRVIRLRVPASADAGFVRGLIPDRLPIQAITFDDNHTSRRYAYARIVFEASAPVVDIDTIVDKLNGLYLGEGCFLSLNRVSNRAKTRNASGSKPIGHENSRDEYSDIKEDTTESEAEDEGLPFGAVEVPEKDDETMQNIYASFAPPTSYMTGSTKVGIPPAYNAFPPPVDAAGSHETSGTVDHYDQGYKHGFESGSRMGRYKARQELKLFETLPQPVSTYAHNSTVEAERRIYQAGYKLGEDEGFKEGYDMAVREAGNEDTAQQSEKKLEIHSEDSITREGFERYYRDGVFGDEKEASLQVETEPAILMSIVVLIHKTIESILRYGPAFEDELMSRDVIRKDEKWSFLFRPQSSEGIYYRWRLWEILSGASGHSFLHPGKYGFENWREIFEGEPPWLEPDDDLPYEFATTMEKFQEDYVTEVPGDPTDPEELEADRSDRQKEQQHMSSQFDALETSNDVTRHLGPLDKAHLTYLLTKLPPTTAKLRKVEVARITAFAIDKAECNAEEIVDLLLANVVKPFNLSLSNALNQVHRATEKADDSAISGDMSKATDVSGSMLIALYVVSDLLHSCAFSGVSSAWKFRSVFDAMFTKYGIFARLGRLERDLGWGRLRADKWKRQIQMLLTAWTEWNIFGDKRLEELRMEFDNPPLTDAEIELENNRKAEKLERENAKPRWKTLESNNPAVEFKGDGDHDVEDDEDVDGDPMEDIDGEPIDDESNDQSSVDGDDVQQNDRAELDQATASEDTVSSNVASMKETAAARARRLRPKAEDMFAASDGE